MTLRGQPGPSHACEAWVDAHKVFFREALATYLTPTTDEGLPVPPANALNL
jgi:hypothetical protein